MNHNDDNHHENDYATEQRIRGAAPDLLYALQLANSVLRVISPAYLDKNPTRTIIEAAIAKAEGKQ
jgi:hypothetical protein